MSISTVSLALSATATAAGYIAPSPLLSAGAGRAAPTRPAPVTRRTTTSAARATARRPDDDAITENCREGERPRCRRCSLRSVPREL
ncbi:hypothetical protein ZWY2020_036335 [Hordeum vulgare]|nr:hypothetical protein ZWY2020_036335 [Hordeum vulgare]